jgi:3'(2'), 5'-bisphosphate nucleotidase
VTVIRGEADIYLHCGGRCEWDSAASVALAQAFGLYCSRIDGSPLVCNQADVCMPDLLNSRKGHAANMLARVREVACG